jgi:integrase
MLETLKQDLLEGKESRKHGERAPRTVNKYLSTVTTILRNEIYLGHLQYCPPIKKCYARSFKRILTQDEVTSLISYFEKRDTDFADTVKVLLDTGMRTGELSQLHAYHIDFEENAIILERMKTKSGKGRTIPMTNRVRKILRRRIAGPHSKVFPYDHCDNYKNRWIKWRRTQPGGLEDKALTPHALRHTCCTRLLAATRDIYAVQKWMGHASIVTTEEYLSLLPGQLDDAAKKLHAFNNKMKSPSMQNTERPIIRRIK